MNKFENKINILHLIEGAKQAEGLTVIIDVFRAFSLECYLYDMDVKEIRPVGTIEEAFGLRNRISDSVLVGERGGKKCEGFDYGNSPSTVVPQAVKGKTIIHTTSAGTQGIVNATGASEIITGSLVNAKAIAEYIKNNNYEEVSLVCMGLEAVSETQEDNLCAYYIKSLLECNPIEIEKEIEKLKITSGVKFFDKKQQDIFPEKDFYLSTEINRFNFVLKLEKDEKTSLDYIRKIDI